MDIGNNRILAKRYKINLISFLLTNIFQIKVFMSFYDKTIRLAKITTKL